MVVAGFAVGLALCVLPALIGFLILQIKQKRCVLPFVIGMAAFVVSQILLRMPLLSRLPQFGWYVDLSINHYYGYWIFLGLTAGLFEETARWVCLRFFLKKRNRYVDGLSFGLGHGGIEAVLIVGISYLNNLIVSVVWAAGGDLTKTFGIPEAEAGTIAVTFASLGFGDIIIGGVERVLALMMHLGFTMLIFYGVRKGQSVRYWIAAILAHGFVDASIGFWQAAGVQGMALEGILAVYALLLFGWVIWCRKHLPEGLPTDSTVEKEMEEREGTEHV